MSMSLSVCTTSLGSRTGLAPAPPELPSLSASSFQRLASGASASLRCDPFSASSSPNVTEEFSGVAPECSGPHAAAERLFTWSSATPAAAPPEELRRVESGLGWLCAPL
uniref:WRKY53-superfamily of TFs having WRKY and zinc finger domains n=1 Tax=Arundo donax TaxID=35708 RepID=A0A0A9GEB7_ARUDO